MAAKIQCRQLAMIDLISLGLERAPSVVSAGARRLDSVIDRLMKS
jgi:hypothetical protein